jgi:hypothetical protein
VRRYIAKRVGFAAISLVLLSVTIFLLGRLTGDPTVLLVEPGASNAEASRPSRAPSSNAGASHGLTTVTRVPAPAAM